VRDRLLEKNNAEIPETDSHPEGKTEPEDQNTPAVHNVGIKH
jgi:hypothetical protein